MLSRIAKLSVKKGLKLQSRSVSSNVTKFKPFNYKKSLIFFGSFGSLAAYDYFVRDGESMGAITRFLRSSRIALEISVDYNLGLRGLDENSPEYDKVIKL
jgi:hypothetical protein